ncbi:MAG: HEAT repeat domain-containing protein [Planctomycetes bacterium]|nr:HEAT repeat domain-containing protein [Planctomycetota bacterium]
MKRAASRLAALSLALLAGTPAALPARAQDAPPATRPSDDQAEVLAKVEKYLELAKSGTAAVRPQAARRLAQLGEPARARLVELAGADGAGLAELGPQVVEIAADFGDAGLRAALWRVLADADFPWRGSAARALAKAPVADEGAAFRGLGADHLWQVRFAALDALRALDLRDARAAVRALLVDQEGAVRRAAAALLVDWGEPGALRWLVEELRREDAYFRVPLGAQARFDAHKRLTELLGDDFGFRPGESPATPANAAALARLEAAARERAGDAWPSELPPIARAAGASTGDVLGLELRSCRAGEFYLRWNDADEVHVGTGNAAVVTLAPGTVERLRAGIERRVAELGDTRFWGEAGCDLEQYRCVGADGELRTWLLSKGQASEGDLRPAPLDAVAELLLLTLPDEASADPRLDRLRSRARAALSVLGGAL